MSGDRSHPEALGAVGKAVLAARASRGEHVSAALEGWAAVGRSVAIAGSIVHPLLLLAARIWLSQVISIHQIMMMMRAERFAEAPAVGAMLIQSAAPLLLATGLATRSMALLLVLGVGQNLSGAHLGAPQAILLIWLLVGGAGPLSFNFLLRGGLARVPVRAMRAATRLYTWSDALGECTLPLGTRLYLAIAIADGNGFAV